MKKALLFLLAAVLTVTLAACGEPAAPETSEADATMATTAVTPAFDKTVSPDSELGQLLSTYIDFCKNAGAFSDPSQIQVPSFVYHCFSLQFLGMDTNADIFWEEESGLTYTTVSVNRIDAITQAILGCTYDFTGIDIETPYGARHYYRAEDNALVDVNVPAGGFFGDDEWNYDLEEEQTFTTEDGIHYTAAYVCKRIHTETKETLIYNQGSVAVKKIDGVYTIVSHTVDIDIDIFGEG